MARILVAGMAVLDFVFNVDEMPCLPQKYRARDAAIIGGGCAANAAVAIARLGGEVVLGARLGDDQLAQLILSDLRERNVNVDWVDLAQGGRSSYSSIYIDSDGERQIMNFKGSGLNQQTEWLENMPQADAILADNRWRTGTAKIMAMAKRRDIPGIIDAEDPVDVDCLKDASHVAFSMQGLASFTGEDEPGAALKSARTALSAWLCVTNGAAGVYFLQNNKVEHINGFGVDAKDTLGAGDVWHGAFTLRMSEGANEIEAVEFANGAAALKCTQSGGRDTYPNRQSTNIFLKEKK